MRKRKKISGLKVIAYIFLIAMAFLYVAPVLWAVLGGFKSNQEIIREGFSIFPKDWTLKNYIDTVTNTTNAPIMRWFWNSAVISVTHTALMVLITSMAAFGYQRLQWKGRDKVFLFLISFSMIPNVINIIPLYSIIDKLGWVDTALACIVPGLGNVVNIFLIRQFLMGVPKELDEAAIIDGASYFGIYTRIILPSIKPVLTVVALFSFTGSWNDFLWPSIVFNDVNHMTVSAGLQLLVGLYNQYMAGNLLAGATVALLPTFLIYLFAQKYFVSTMSFAAAVKG